MKDSWNEFNTLKEIIDWSRTFLASQGFCIICGHDDPLDLEFHHVGRKRNDEEFLVSLCRNCHGRFTRKQRWWPKSSLSHKNTPTLKLAFVFLGLGQILIEKARRIFEKYGVEYQ